MSIVPPSTAGRPVSGSRRGGRRRSAAAGGRQLTLSSTSTSHSGASTITSWPMGAAASKVCHDLSALHSAYALSKVAGALQVLPLEDVDDVRDVGVEVDVLA